MNSACENYSRTKRNVRNLQQREMIAPQANPELATLRNQALQLWTTIEKDKAS